MSSSHAHHCTIKGTRRGTLQEQADPMLSDGNKLLRRPAGREFIVVPVWTAAR